MEIFSMPVLKLLASSTNYMDLICTSRNASVKNYDSIDLKGVMK